VDTRQRNKLARRHLRYGQDSPELDRLRQNYSKSEIINQWDLFWNEETKSWFHSYYDRNGKRDAYNTGIGDPLDPHRAAAQVDKDGVSDGADFLRASGQVGAMLENRRLDNYENPFAASEREIGQMDVTIEEEELVRESIRTIILEANGFSCNNHSLGWINTEGTWIDCSGDSHNEWLYHYYYKGSIPKSAIENPFNWIKVSTAGQIFLCGKSWEDVTENQINGLIEMWGACSKYSRWIESETETFKVLFGIIESDKMPDNYDNPAQSMTIPEFLGMYGSRRSIDNFYGMLLGEL